MRFKTNLFSFFIFPQRPLANVLRAGKLPAAAEIVQSEVVGPSLGQEAIDNGTTSAIIGLLIVSLWMIVYYGKSGWFANIALNGEQLAESTTNAARTSG